MFPRMAYLAVLFFTAVNSIGQTSGPASTNGTANAILDSAPGKKFVGNQLRTFSMEPDGAMLSTRDNQINLYYTEGAPFRLSGKVWLGGPSKTLDFPKDLPDGFALFLREWDSLHRYSLTSRSLVNKRRLLEGAKEQKIAQVAKFEAPAIGQWISFSVEATPDQISFQFGQQFAVIKGPLDMDGANKIVLAPGTKIKDVQLEILEASPISNPPTSEEKSSTSSAAQATSAPLSAKLDSNGKLALSFHTVPGQTYRLQFKNDLADPTWTPLGEPVKATSSALIIQDDTAQPRRFYNVVVGP
ncbi:MAG: hypothetical protein JWQ71_828 [Pedosphaera sp.]|nr:hypothetical protein [Pedosphaera sp.]